MRQRTDGCWPQLHGNFTPAHTDGCAAQCFEGVQRGSLIILPVHPRPQAATPVSRPGFVAHLFGRGPVLRTCNRVMAHRPTGFTQTDRIRLPYAARRLSLSRNNRLCRPVTVHRFRCAVTERQIAHNGKRGKGTRSPHGLKDYPT